MVYRAIEWFLEYLWIFFVFCLAQASIVIRDKIKRYNKSLHDLFSGDSKQPTDTLKQILCRLVLHTEELFSDRLLQSTLY